MGIILPPLPFPSFSPVKCIRSTPEYFAERLFKAMKVSSEVSGNEVEGSFCPHPQDCWDLEPVLV